MPFSFLELNSIIMYAPFLAMVILDEVVDISHFSIEHGLNSMTFIWLLCPATDWIRVVGELSL